MNFLQTKLNEMKKRKEEGNKGFSLVELIIVIAIMAILVGIVGTQVIPYINKSKESKDYQLINSYSTAATTAYGTFAEDIETAAGTTKKLTINVYEDGKDDATDGTKKNVAKEIIKLVGYDDISALTNKMQSKDKSSITGISVEIDLGNKKITTTATGATGQLAKAVVAEL